jgi:hypothetical protein
MRLAACDPHLRKPRWASAAAYIADHPDKAPTFRAAIRLMQRTPNGITGLSYLYSAQHKQSPEPVDMAGWADAQLEGIPPDAAFDGVGASATKAPSYTMAIVRRMPDGSSRTWFLHEADEFGVPVIRRAVKKIKNRTILEDGPRIYIERSIEALAQSKAQSAPGATVHNGEDSPTQRDGDVARGEPQPGKDGGVKLSLPRPVGQPANAKPTKGKFERKLICNLPPSCGCQHHKLCREQGHCVESLSPRPPALAMMPVAAD